MFNLPHNILNRYPTGYAVFEILCYSCCYRNWKYVQYLYILFLTSCSPILYTVKYMMCLCDCDLSSILYNMAVRKSQNGQYNIQNLTMENGNCESRTREPFNHNKLISSVHCVVTIKRRRCRLESFCPVEQVTSLMAESVPHSS